jgi:hypothetical protein
VAEKRKRPRDVNEMAKAIVKDATQGREAITVVFAPTVDDRRTRRSVSVEEESAVDSSRSSLTVD